MLCLFWRHFQRKVASVDGCHGRSNLYPSWKLFTQHEPAVSFSIGLNCHVSTYIYGYMYLLPVPLEFFSDDEFLSGGRPLGQKTLSVTSFLLNAVSHVYRIPGQIIGPGFFLINIRIKDLITLSRWAKPAAPYSRILATHISPFWGITFLRNLCSVY